MICPLRSEFGEKGEYRSGEDMGCHGADCGWWSERRKRCGVALLADGVDGLRESMEQIAEIVYQRWGVL